LVGRRKKNGGERDKPKKKGVGVKPTVRGDSEGSKKKTSAKIEKGPAKSADQGRASTSVITDHSTAGKRGWG